MLHPDAVAALMAGDHGEPFAALGIDPEQPRLPGFLRHAFARKMNVVGQRHGVFPSGSR